MAPCAHERKLLLVLGLAACTATPIEIRDGGATQVEGRFLYRWDEPDAEGAWSGLELEVGGADGDDTQELALGDAVDFGGTTFLGPGPLAIDYELRRASLAFVHGRENEEVRAWIALGLGWQEIDLRLATATQRAHGSDGWGGVLAALGFRWSPVELVGLETRGELLTQLEASRSELEVAAVFPPRAPLGLALGWRWVDSYTVLEGGSDVDLRLNGPFVALRVTF